MKQAKVLTDKDIKIVQAYISRSSFAVRNRCMFMLTHYSGMRVGEIAALSIDDVVDANGRVKDQILLKKHQTKGNEARTVLLNTNAQHEIEIYMRNNKRDKTQPLFISKAGTRFSSNSLCQVFGRIYHKCGLDTATSHSGRRTYLTSLANKGIGIHLLAALAGHKNISTTMVYLNANVDMLRAAVELV